MKFNTIAADPPWKYDNVNTGGSMKSGSAAKYPTMALDEIKDLRVRDIANKNSLLFLWATTPLKPEAMEVVKAWGYKYVTTLYWLKTGRPGLGFWFRGCFEECLVCKRGKVKPFHSQMTNLIVEDPREHSRKPDEFYNIVRLHAPDPMVELFAREPRIGFISMGLDMDGQDISRAIAQISAF